MEFEWDEDKNKANHAKHKISFELASSVFDDPLAVYRLDCVVDGEERWLAVGRAVDMSLVVVHIYRCRDDKEYIRIISARLLTTHERKLYEEG
jgi:uncharacterized DUF497 family protein